MCTLGKSHQYYPINKHSFFSTHINYNVLKNRPTYKGIKFISYLQQKVTTINNIDTFTRQLKVHLIETPLYSLDELFSY